MADESGFRTTKLLTQTMRRIVAMSTVAASIIACSLAAQQEGPLPGKLDETLDRDRCQMLDMQGRSKLLHGSYRQLHCVGAGHRGHAAKLVIAQDTGGAISAAPRADYFCGSGPQAADLAGRMRQQGSLWLVWPRDVPLPPRTQ